MWTFEQIYEGALNKIEEANYPGIYKVYIPDGFIVEFKSETDAIGDKNNIKAIHLLERRMNLINRVNKGEGNNILYIQHRRRDSGGYHSDFQMEIIRKANNRLIWRKEQ